MSGGRQKKISWAGGENENANFGPALGAREKDLDDFERIIVNYELNFNRRTSMQLQSANFNATSIGELQCNFNR